jgi:hypothetical protein
MANIYFELTEAFNAVRPTAALASGQAVVYYRVAIMSKDGDWVLREDADACERVLAVLAERGARYRPSAPLDLRWLAGGWSSHLEFSDDRQRRVRCDFVTRPPRVAKRVLDDLFASAHARLLVVDLESLIRLKLTQRAKDYAVIGALAARLPPERELEYSTDPDRLVALFASLGPPTTRPRVADALVRADRRAVVLALAEEADEHQQRDRRRVEAYTRAAQPYLDGCRELRLSEMNLREAHQRLVELAGRTLPEAPHATAQ